MMRIGASEVAVILGVSPWSTPLRLWEEKTGLVERERGTGEWLEWGTLLEPLIAKRYGEKSGRTVRHYHQGSLIANRRHPTIDCFACSLDGEVDDPTEPERGTGVLECKNVVAFKEGEWRDGAPIHYQVQGQAAMACTGYRWASFPHLIGGNKLAWSDHERNEGFIAAMEAKVREFIQLVIVKRAPTFGDWLTDRDGAALADLFPKGDGDVALDADAQFAVSELRRLDAEIAEHEAVTKPLDKQRDLLKNQVRAAIGDKERGLMPDGAGYSWKEQETKGYTVEARTGRVLRAFKAPRMVRRAGGQ